MALETASKSQLPSIMWGQIINHCGANGTYQKQGCLTEMFYSVEANWSTVQPLKIQTN